MKTSRIIAALLCASMGLSAAATFAQPAPGGPGYHDDHGAPNQRHDDRGGPDNRGDHGGPNHGGPDHRPPPPMHADNGPHHEDWRRGQAVPRDYRDHQYRVDDWHDHGLRQPPRGYDWVQVGGDYLLIAAATGIIADMVLAH